MAKGTKIDSTGEMLKVANSMNEQLEAYTTAINGMYTLGEELDSYWDGMASEKFKERFANDREKFEKLRNIIENYINTLKDNVNTYTSGEERAMETLSTNKHK